MIQKKAIPSKLMIAFFCIRTVVKFLLFQKNFFCRFKKTPTNIAEKLKTTVKGLKYADYKMLILIFAGLSVNAICVICDIERGNYYIKRQRLRDRIQQSDSVYCELFLSHMNMSVE